MNYSIFLDSGAYSAMTQGVTIDIKEYITFIKKYIDCIDYYAALDVIGDPEQSYKNTRYMIKRGLKPIPVYHLNSRKLYWFERLVNEFEFVGIGGMVATVVDKKERLYYLNRCFNYLSNHDLLDSVKIHGFACTSIYLMTQFPWYSVDSSTWIQVSRHGGILVPRNIFGSKLFDADKPIISVSDRRPNVSTYWKKLPKKYRHRLIGYLKRVGSEYFNDPNRYKFDRIGRGKKSYRFRDELCAIYFRELELELNQSTVRFGSERSLI